jgi:DNA-binding winged helix-turn-helix (wHTH) protein/Flp pilus assembly protein TadD
MRDAKMLIYQFDGFQLSPGERQLLRTGKSIPLTPKAFETLLALVEREKKLVTKDELMEIVWGDVIVEETGLSRNISVLRKVLDDNDHKKPKYIETVSGYGYRFVGSVKKSVRNADSENIKSVLLAVLPFQTVGLDEQDKYLGLGIADSLITRLSHIKRLIVRPIGSVLKYIGEERNPLEVGEQLGAEIVLDGTITKFGNTIRVTVQSFNPARLGEEFTEIFEAELENFPKLQDLISEQIAQKVLVNLTPDEREALIPANSPNSEAYQEYLRGRYYFNRKTPQNLLEALEHFLTATYLDPNFALAHCGLADVHANLHLRMSLSSTSSQLVKARKSLGKALELDQNIAEVHATLGYFAYFYEWDWEKAEEEFKRGIAINPNDINTLQLYANFLSRMGRFAEADEFVQRALELDSSSFPNLFLKAQICYRQNNFELAWQITEKLIDEYPKEPKLYHVFLLLGTSYSLRRMHDEALKTLQKAERFSLRSRDGAKELLGTFGAFYARQGSIEEAEECLKKLENLSEENDVTYELAAVYANLGRFDEAFRMLETMVEKRNWQLVHLKAELDFFVLHNDRRFSDLLHAVGIEKRENSGSVFSDINR